MLQDWTTAFIDGNLCLPSQNLFIPTDFSIRDPAPKVITALPALVASLTIQETYIWSFYYWQYSVQIFTIPNGGTSKWGWPLWVMVFQSSQVKHPFILRKTPLSRLWYKPDTNFHTPKACIQIQFNCPESNYSPEATVLTSIFTRLLVDYLNEYG